jgi:hypothetical protein
LRLRNPFSMDKGNLFWAYAGSIRKQAGLVCVGGQPNLFRRHRGFDRDQRTIVSLERYPPLGASAGRKFPEGRTGGALVLIACQHEPMSRIR